MIQIDLHILAPCGKCNYECLRETEECPRLSEGQRKVMETICESDLVYFVVPNYCGYPCANYFAFNERSAEIPKAKVPRAI